MYYNTIILPLFAAAASLSAASPTPAPQYWTITNFEAFHAHQSDYSLNKAVTYASHSVNFDVQLPDNGVDEPITTHCYSSAISPVSNGLAEFAEHPCNSDYFYFTLDKSGPNGQWKLNVGEVDSGANYIFPADAQSTYTYPDALSGTEESYQQLTVPGGNFKAQSIN